MGGLASQVFDSDIGEEGGVVERVFKVKKNDKCERIESVRDSAEHDMEDTK